MVRFATAMTPNDHGYARLPEDLLHALLDEAGPITRRVEELLGIGIEHRDKLRAALNDLGLITRFNRVGTVAVAGVDGGFALERTLAVDLLLSVAVGVEGLGSDSQGWGKNQFRWWADAMPHNIELERIARGVMVAQELWILAEAPHPLRILDGSHITLVIQLNAALTTQSEDIRTAAKKQWSDLDTANALAEAASSPTVIAMPKYDSSRDIAIQLEKILGEPVPGDDKYLMDLLLDGGELIEPQQVPAQPWSQLHFNAQQNDAEIEQAFVAAIKPLKQRQLCYTYVKPSHDSPAYRLEIKDDAVSNMDQICSTLASQITGPFVREPYPQYLADVMAKSVGLGLSALQTAVQLALSGGGKPEIAQVMQRSYRTDGV